MIKHATPDHPVHDLIVRRWSPYGFDGRPVAREDVCALFEAARWAASSFNEQPWRYIVAVREDAAEFERLLSCLMEGNRSWAGSAPVLALGAARLNFTRNDAPNAVALHDLGLASGNLSVEATARGLHVHQMRGILPDLAREVYGVPAGFEVVTALAIGYAAPPEELAPPLRERDLAPRSRRPLGESVFSGAWGEAAGVLSPS